MSVRPGESGRASLEFLTAAIVLLIPIMFLGMSVSSLQNASLAAETAARNAARIFVQEVSTPVAASRAQTAIRIALANHGIHSVRSWERFCSSSNCLAPGSVVTIRVSVDAPLMTASLFPSNWAPPSVPVVAEATAMVSRYGGAP
jgi:hypothetical protein